MRRLLSFLPLLGLLFAFAGCASAPRAALATGTAVPGVALQEDDGAVDEMRTEPNGPGFGDYALVVPENVVWIPWKIIVGTGKGLVDGIGAGFDNGRDRILGLIFSPVNGVVGLLTGFGVGVVSEPGFIGPRTSFGRTMGLPSQRPTPIWWLTD